MTINSNKIWFGLTSLILVGYLGLITFGHYYPLEVVVNFRLQISVFVFLCAVLSLAFARWKFSIVLLLTTILFVLPLAYVRTSLEQVPDTDGEVIEVIFSNVAHSQSVMEELFQKHVTSSTDLILLAEAPTVDWSNERKIWSKYPHRNFRSTGWASGLAGLSRYEFAEFDYENRFIPGRIPWVRARIQLNDRDLTFWVMHPPNPLTPSKFNARNQMVQSLDKVIERDTDVPQFVLGDFNLTPYSHYYPSFKQGTVWRSATKGSPFQFTWPSGYPFLYLSLDHFFYRPPIRVKSFNVLDSVGSDHYPIRIRVGIDSGK